VICSCGRDLRADAYFCDACGAPVGHAGVVGERRRLTALSCDIVGYTELTERLDGEDLQRLIQSYQRLVEHAVTRWGGEIDCYSGDGVDAFFGLTAHENDAERAVRAGLDIVAGLEAMRVTALQSEQTLPSLRVRVGIHSGPVVVGAQGTAASGKKQALGPAMNGAARLQNLARPGTVVIGEATHRLVAELFACSDLGKQTLKGIKEPMRAFVVLRAEAHRDRAEGQRDHRAPLIGRQRELAVLVDCWRLALAGRRTTVSISGDAGIGKSRLVRALVKSAGIDLTGGVFEWRCSPFHASTPFYPVADALQRHLGHEPATPRDEVAARVQAYVAAIDPSLEGSAIGEAASLLSELASPPLKPSSTAVHETPAVRRARTLTLICSLVSAQALRRPTLLIVEDVHWADPSTIEVLNQLIHLDSNLGLMLVLTFRPDFAPPWAGTGDVQLLGLEPLNTEESATLFDALVGERSIPPDIRDDIVSRADGVPLFVEELTRALVETKEDSIEKAASSIPDTLQGLLASRVDRLSTGARDTIRLAAALSRDVRFDLLAGVGDKAATALRDDLNELVAAGLLSRRKADSGDSYGFKHALVADSVYDSILRTERRRLHLQIARRLSESFPAIVLEQPEMLARHFREADSVEEAIEYWQRAGDRAIDRGAYQEAVSHLDDALALMPRLASDEHRIAKEIELTESKGTALFSMLGYAHPLVEQTFARASALCEQGGNAPPLRVLYGIWAVHMTRSNREAIETLLPRFVELASTGNPIAGHTARANTGVVAFFAGRFAQCLEEMTESAKAYREVGHSAQWHGYGGGMYPFAYRMWSLAILGRIEEAVATGEELQRLARQASNPYSIAIADGFCANLARERRDFAQALALADRQIDYTRRQLLPFWEGPAHCTRGWARAFLGEVDEGIAEIRLGLQYLDAVGLRTTYPYQLGALAEALLVAGEITGAREAAEQGLAISATAFDRFYEAELLRLLSEAMRRAGDAATAEAGLRRALALAQQQSATLFALRAAASLAQVLIESGKSDEARQTLGAVLSEVSSGVDVREALNVRHLLAGLA
jgi:class 3 adenylate cyclase/tetratricopeptide (TPR) repeat protein